MSFLTRKLKQLSATVGRVISGPIVNASDKAAKFAQAHKKQIEAAMAVAALIAVGNYTGATASIGSYIRLHTFQAAANFASIAQYVGKKAAVALKAAQKFENNYIKPIVEPITKTINTVTALEKAIAADLKNGLQGMLKIPGQLVNAMTGVEASFKRSAETLGFINNKTATDVLAPSIERAGHVPIGRLTGTLQQALPASNVDVTVKQQFALDTPPGEDELALLLSKGVGYVNKTKGWIGNILGGIWDIFTAVPLIESYMEPRKEVYAELAFRAQPVKRFDIGIIQSLYGLGYITKEEAKDAILTQGYDESRQDLLLQLTEYVFSINLGLDLWHRGMMDDTTLNALFEQLSYNEQQATATKQQSFRVAGVQEAIQWFWRGHISESDLNQVLRDNRYTVGDIDNILATLTPAPSESLAINMHGMKQAQANGWLPGNNLSDVPVYILDMGRAKGVDDADIVREWGGHWNIPGPNFWTSSYYRQLINLDQVFGAFEAMKIPEQLWQTVVDQQHTLIRLTYIASLVAGGMINDVEGKDKLKAYGYTDGDADLMLQYAKRRGKKSKNTTAVKLHQTSISVAVGLYKQHAFDDGQLRDVLLAHGYSEEAARLTVELESLQLQAATRREEGAFLVDLVKLGKIDSATAVSKMYDAGFSPGEVLHYERQITKNRVKKFKTPGEAELAKMFKKGIITEQDLYDAMINSGYDDTWAMRIVKLHTS